MSNGEDCLFSPRALLLYEMAKRRATRTIAESCQNDEKSTGRRTESEGEIEGQAVKFNVAVAEAGMVKPGRGLPFAPRSNDTRR